MKNSREKHYIGYYLNIRCKSQRSIQASMFFKTCLVIPMSSQVGEPVVYSNHQGSSRDLEAVRKLSWRRSSFSWLIQAVPLAQPTSDAEFIPSTNCYWPLWCARDGGYIPEQGKPSPVLIEHTLENGDGRMCQRINMVLRRIVISAIKKRKQQRCRVTWVREEGSEGFLQSWHLS